MQKGGARQTALVVLPHAEMLRERNRKTGDKEAMAKAAVMMATDGRQPFAQRGVLDGFEHLVFGFHNVVERQRNPGRELFEYLDHHRVRSGNAAAQDFAAIGGVEFIAVRKCRTDTLQNTLRVKWPRDRVGCAQRPGLHRAVMKGVGENE